MAGDGHHHTVKIDPAIERYAKMREEQYTHFRLSPRSARLTLIWAVAVPVTFGLWWTQHDDYWNWAGKGHGDSLRKRPDPADAAKAATAGRE